MTVHLPWPNLAASALVLHHDHLSRTRVSAIETGDPWAHWYHSVLAREMQRRGMLLMHPMAYTADGQKNEKVYGPLPDLSDIETPGWVGDPDVHNEHRAELYEEFPQWYSNQEWRHVLD